MTGAVVPLDEFVSEAKAWLDDHAEKLSDEDAEEFVWNKGEFNVAVFHSLSPDDERALLERLKEWTQLKSGRGYHAVSAPPEYGGLGLPPEYARAFAELEAGYVRPASHETHSVTTR